MRQIIWLGPTKYNIFNFSECFIKLHYDSLVYEGFFWGKIDLIFNDCFKGRSNVEI